MALALCAAVSACGDDGDDGSAAAGTDAAGTGSTAGTSAGTSTAGSGAAGATAGGTTAAGTPAMPMTVECGTETCMVEGIVATFGAMACCVDAATSTCGTTMGGAECMPPAPPGTPDDRCTPDSEGSPIPLTGCCIEDMCGVDLSSLGQGCIEYSQLTVLAQMFGAASSLFSVPDSRRCDDPPPEMDADAGM